MLWLSGLKNAMDLMGLQILTFHVSSFDTLSSSSEKLSTHPGPSVVDPLLAALPYLYIDFNISFYFCNMRFAYGALIGWLSVRPTAVEGREMLFWRDKQK
jgi:hypothetical protein